MSNWVIEQVGLDGYNAGTTFLSFLTLPSKTLLNLLFLPVVDNFGRYLGFLAFDYFLLVLLAFFPSLSCII